MNNLFDGLDVPSRAEGLEPLPPTERASSPPVFHPPTQQAPQQGWHYQAPPTQPGWVYQPPVAATVQSRPRSEAETRMRRAQLYNELLQGTFFDGQDEDTQAVEEEIQQFVRHRLEVLLGMAPDEVSTTGFTAEEVRALKMLAARVTPMATQKAEVRRESPPRPHIRPRPVPGGVGRQLVPPAPQFLQPPPQWYPPPQVPPGYQYPPPPPWAYPPPSLQPQPAPPPYSPQPQPVSQSQVPIYAEGTLLGEGPNQVRVTWKDMGPYEYGEAGYVLTKDLSPGQATLLPNGLTVKREATGDLKKMIRTAVGKGQAISQQALPPLSPQALAGVTAARAASAVQHLDGMALQAAQQIIRGST